MPRRKKKLSQADKGRVLLKEQKAENVTAVSGFDIDEMVQYYISGDGVGTGWRCGYLRELPVRGLNRGRARVENLVTHKKSWVDGTGLKKMEG